MSMGSLHGYASPRRRWGRRLLIGVAVVVLLVAAFAAAQLIRSMPAVRVSIVLPAEVRVGRPARLPWPPRGSAAAEVLGIGSLGSFRGDRVIPLASLTKLMTALAVLKNPPLSPEASGPQLSISPADAAAYKADLAPASRCSR